MVTLLGSLRKRHGSAKAWSRAARFGVSPTTDCSHTRSISPNEASPAGGPQHPDTLASRYLVAHLLDRLGHTDEALPIARAVAKAYEASPTLGLQHPQTLASRHLVARLLYGLGHTDEALPIARAVAEASPALGPQHPDTLASRDFLADLLVLLRQ
jgi:hypothetical protein